MKLQECVVYVLWRAFWPEWHVLWNVTEGAKLYQGRLKSEIPMQKNRMIWYIRRWTVIPNRVLCW